METLTLDELLERCAKRLSDAAAWEEFVHRYHSIIRDSIVKTLHHKIREEDSGKQVSDEVVDDLVSEVYLRLVQARSCALKDFEGAQDDSFLEYLSTMAIEVVRDYLREASAQKRQKTAYSLAKLMQNLWDSILGRGRADETSTASKPATLEELNRALEKDFSDRHRKRKRH